MTGKPLSYSGLLLKSNPQKRMLLKDVKNRIGLQQEIARVDMKVLRGQQLLEIGLS